MLSPTTKQCTWLSGTSNHESGKVTGLMRLRIWTNGHSSKQKEVALLNDTRILHPGALFCSQSFPNLGRIAHWALEKPAGDALDSASGFDEDAKAIEIFHCFFVA